MGLFFIKLCETCPDETARAALQLFGGVSTLRTFERDRFRVSRPITQGIMKQYPVVVQTGGEVMEGTGAIPRNHSISGFQRPPSFMVPGSGSPVMMICHCRVLSSRVVSGSIFQPGSNW